MIGVIDYGLGNVKAILNIYNNLDIAAFAVSSKNELEKATSLILPGVGAFDWAIARLNESGLRDRLDKLVMDNCIPVLGICVGMQMMSCSSEEGEMDGLGWVEGKVKHFRSNAGSFKDNMDVPHMGWNNIYVENKHRLFEGIEDNAGFYFLHSYYFLEKNKGQIISRTNYHGWFTSCFGKENIVGVQFHPEKSHTWGVRLLQNFASI